MRLLALLFTFGLVLLALPSLLSGTSSYLPTPGFLLLSALGVLLLIKKVKA